MPAEPTPTPAVEPTPTCLNCGHSRRAHGRVKGYCYAASGCDCAGFTPSSAPAIDARETTGWENLLDARKQETRCAGCSRVLLPSPDTNMVWLRWTCADMTCPYYKREQRIESASAYLADATRASDAPHCTRSDCDAPRSRCADDPEGGYALCRRFIVAAAAPTAEGPRGHHLPDCRKPVAYTSRFCTYCGADSQDAPAAAIPGAQEPIRDELLAWLKERGDRPIAQVSARQIVMLYEVVAAMDRLTARLQQSDREREGLRTALTQLVEGVDALNVGPVNGEWSSEEARAVGFSMGYARAALSYLASRVASVPGT